jgi:sulfite exporter TauE/SafE
METGYIAAFTTGFLGGMGHCIGMCGPIVSSYTLSDRSSANIVSRFLTHIFYNTGRIMTYMFVGALMGLTGSFINTAGSISGFQNIVSVIAGLIIILMGLNISGIIGKGTWLEGHNNFVIRAGREFLHEHSLWRYYPLGALLGFLPCGLSYSAFMAAAGTGSLLSGMFLMLFFGLGTLPALLIFGLAASYISIKLRGLLYRTAGVIVIITGIYFLLKGIRLYASV